MGDPLRFDTTDGKLRAQDETIAMRADPEKMHRGEAMFSAECHGQLLELGYVVEENLAAFLKLVHTLSGIEQVLLISTYVLLKANTPLARNLGYTQSTVSKLVRRSLDALRKNTAPIKQDRHHHAPVLYLTDPPCLGEFRNSVLDSDFLFQPNSPVRGWDGMDYSSSPDEY